MRIPDTRTVFAGVDARSEAQLPEWYAQYHQCSEPVTFAEAIRQLLRASTPTQPEMAEWRFLLDEIIDPKAAMYLEKEGIDADQDATVMLHPPSAEQFGYGPEENPLDNDAINGPGTPSRTTPRRTSWPWLQKKPARGRQATAR